MAEQYQVSSSAAENYERNNVPLSFGPWAKVLVEHGELDVGERVLDLACGTGIVARTAVTLVGNSGRVVGVDLNTDMITEAAKHVPPGMSIEWQEGDAQELPFEDSAFDVVLCQQALQYIPDRAAAVSEMHRVLRQGGRAIVSVWRGLEHNPIPRTWHQCISKHLSPEAGALFAAAFADEFDNPNLLIELFTAGGFDIVTVEPTELVIPAEDPRGRMVGPLKGTPVADQIDAMSPADFGALVADMLTAVEPWIVEGRLEAPTAAQIVRAEKR